MEQMDSLFMTAFVVFALPTAGFVALALAMVLLGGDTTDEEEQLDAQSTETE